MWLARPNAELPGWASTVEHVHASPNILPWAPKQGGTNVVQVDFNRSLPAVELEDAGVRLFDLARVPLRQELEDAMSLEDGWDGPRTKAPSEEAISAAMTFVESIPNGFFLPEVSIGTDGEVNVGWRDEDHFVDVSFYDDTGGSVFVRVGDSKARMAGVFDFAKLPTLAQCAVAAG